MSSRVDLRELAVDREPREPPRRRRAVYSRYLVPAVILGGFASILGWSLRDGLRSAKQVTVIPVVAARAEFAAAETPLFQAAGWVEPRPQPVVVTALTEGVIEQMLVVEGDAVEAGQVVARLISRDAEIEVERAKADVELRQAELDVAAAELTAAKAFHEEPLVRLVELAASEAELTKVETEIARLPALVRGAEAKRDFSKQEVDSKSQAGAAVPPIALQRVKSELASASALVDELHQQLKSLDRQRVALAKRRDALQRQLELKIDETRRVAEATAQVAAGQARLQQARAALDAARLKLERTEVKANSSGCVLSLLAKPGSRLMGMERAALVDASSVITLYDPESLQVRADVRLEDVSRVTPGQAVRLATSASEQPLSGRVIGVTSLADIQKNTLQVKVLIDDPPAVIKPDMLVQATFLAQPRSSDGDNVLPLRMLIPSQLIDGSAVWIADQSTSTARRRSVTIGAPAAGGLVEITSGLNVGDRLIVAGRDSLSEGDRIRILRKDTEIGRGLLNPGPSSNPDSSD